jgi:hypothetical protein
MHPCIKELTTRVVLGVLLWMPAVMRSNFSFRLPVQGCRLTGTKFCLKSPAVGLMKRHCPFAALRETPVKARVAVSSRLFASAAEDGLRVPPAPETGTGVDGLEVSDFMITSPAMADTAGAESEEVAEEVAAVLLGPALDAARVTKTVGTELH